MPPDMHPTNPIIVYFLKWYAMCPWISLLLLVMMLDVVSGLTAAIIEKKLNSKIGYVGATKKAACLIVIGLASLLEQAVQGSLPENMQNGLTIPLGKLCAGFFLINESLSVLENAKRSGVPLPEFLTKSLSDTFAKLVTHVTTPATDDMTVNIHKNNNLQEITTTVTSDSDIVHKSVHKIANPDSNTANVIDQPGAKS